MSGLHGSNGMRIHKLILPTPFYIGPVNVYLIDDQPLTLFDTGPDTPEALTGLEEQLDSAGHGLKEIKRIIISHTHRDHCGLAGRIQKISGAPVFVHPWEESRLTQSFDPLQAGRMLAQLGVPKEVLELFDGRRRRYQGSDEALTDVKLLQEGDDLGFTSGSFRVIHTPGHTPGHICLYREGEKLLIAGDTVLEKITPNPVINPDPGVPERRFPSLRVYHESLDRLRRISPALVYTGHGREVTDLDAYYSGMRRHSKERQQKAMDLLADGSASAWELAQRLFPNMSGDHVFLAVSETSAHLDLAASEGLVAMAERDGVQYFRRTTK